MKRTGDKNLYVCMLLCFLTAAASFVYYMCLDGGIAGTGMAALAFDGITSLSIRPIRIICFIGGV